jgi:hypothetical protein
MKQREKEKEREKERESLRMPTPNFKGQKVLTERASPCSGK